MMSDTILVAYASRSGSTAAIAEAIGETIADANSGLKVDVRSMTELTDLTPYRAVIAGSAIQDKHWLPEAMDFMQTHRVVLSQKPFAAFLVCMTLTIRNGKYKSMVVEWMQPVRAIVKPIHEGYFSGALDISKIPSLGDRMKFKLSVATGIWSEGNHQDWAAIRQWANEVGLMLAV